MADNRSLDEFVEAEASSESAVSEPEPDLDAGSVEPDDTAVDEAAEPVRDGVESDAGIDPMPETFAWSATRGECERCGDAVEERWRDDDGMVCAGCKAW